MLRKLPSYVKFRTKLCCESVHMDCVILLTSCKYLPHQFTILVRELKARRNVSSLKSTNDEENKIIVEHQIENCIGSMKFVTENTE